MRYASNTQVSVEKSKAEIERTLTRYGAEQFITGWDQNKAVIGFKLHNRMIRFNLPLPDKRADEFRLTPAGKKERSEQDQYRSWEQACRQRWRALGIAIKAKLEAVECGITTFEEEFLAHIVLPNGKTTVGDWLVPQIEQVYESGKLPKLLPGS